MAFGRFLRSANHFAVRFAHESSAGRRGKAAAFRGATVFTAVCFALDFRFTVEAMLVCSRKVANVGLVAPSRFENRVLFFAVACRNAS